MYKMLFTPTFGQLLNRGSCDSNQASTVLSRPVKLLPTVLRATCRLLIFKLYTFGPSGAYGGSCRVFF